MPYSKTVDSREESDLAPLLLEFQERGRYPSEHVFTFLCYCGKIFNTTLKSIKSGHSTSCGCFKNNLLKQRSFRHGHSTRVYWSGTYTSWVAMLQRCENSSHSDYTYYGAKGVKVCPRWHVFNAFLNDMGDRPTGKTLDRINPFGDYEPGNCRWATPAQQAKNQRRNYALHIS